MRKALYLSLLLMLAAICSIGQTREISGKVTDGKGGSPLAGVTVMVKGSQSATTTNTAGVFRITVPSNIRTLVFSSVGYATEEVTITTSGVVNVSMTLEEKKLDEVVVVAYGTSRKESFTGSATKINGSEFTSRPMTNIVNALAGSAPGIQASANSGQPGSAPSIRIRGFGSINASADPLYVVDGVPFSGDIANINMDDVDNISILKDASSSSLYGARAANGVVMITTKKGRKGKPQISVRATKGFSDRAIPEYERVNAYQYYPLMWEALRNSLAYRASNPLSLAQASQVASGLVTGQNGVKEVLAYNPFNVASNNIVRPDGTLNPDAQLIYSNDDLDWEGRLTRIGIRDDYNINYGGGLDKTDYFVSLGYLRDKGFLIKTDFERYTARVNMNTQMLPWLKSGFNVAGTFTKSNIAADPTTRQAASTSFVNPFFFSRNIGPIYPVYAQNPTTGAYILDPLTGNKQYDFGNLSALGLPNRPGGGFGGRHAIAETELNENFFNTNVWSARTYGEVSFLKDFKFTANASVDVTNRRLINYQNRIVGDGAPAGSLTLTNRKITSSNFNQLLNYTKKIDRHAVEFLLGHENFKLVDDYSLAARQNQIADGIYELVNFSTTTSLTSTQDNYRVEGYFSRLNYNYAGKYIASLSFRRDGSSRFSPKERWGNFWSASAAWKLDEENFIKEISWITQLKLRTSYGETGNDVLLPPTNTEVLYAGGPQTYYPWQPTFGLGLNNGTEPGIVRGSYADPNSPTAAVTSFGSLGNPDLTWESNSSFDAGIEFRLFKNRLGGSIEYFRRGSDNLLFYVPLPISSGILFQPRNIGSMVNKGWEINLNADVIKTKNFTWNLEVNLTTFKNEITKLPQEEIIIGTKKYKVGKSIYDFWLRDYQGVDPADGAVLYRAAVYDPANSRIRGKDDTVTVNQNNAKFAYHGSAIPDFYGSISTSIKYKFIDLSFLMTYQVGGKIFDGTYQSLMSSGNYGGAAHVDLLKRWQKPGDITNVPRMDAGQTGAFNANSSRWLIDASNIAIRNITLGFTVPKKLLDVAKLQSGRFYVSGENLGLFSKRKGMNVEQNFSGITTNVFAPVRTITVGVNITL